MAPSARVLVLRSAVLRATRVWFQERGFTELDPPLLHAGVPLEATIEPLSVVVRDAAGNPSTRYLPTSPEGGLKQGLALLGADCFELGHAFRDGEDEGPQHRVHFRMLEWYRAGADHRRIQEDCEQLVHHLGEVLIRLNVAPAFPDLAPPWRRVRVTEAVGEVTGLRLREPEDLESFPERAARRGRVPFGLDWQDALAMVVALEVVPALGPAPLLLTHFPVGMAAQARACPREPWLAEQFEFYVGGMELGNCYTEITDADEQRQRFNRERRRLDPESPTRPPPDRGYLAALDALPRPCAGGSMGLDRLLMVLLDRKDIGEVRLG